MQITLNGDKVDITDGLTLSALLTEQKVQNPDMVSVQIDGEFIDKDQYQSTTIQEGQEVDFLYFMGGGSRE